ncbi:flagellar hook-length control protein FliK [Phenylobacterium sp.]|uniref:flagellar hook-length control protein FliK n=1 Tax=Phenylobacterium sp. TaxID=1871053 RepID=UPI002734F9D8|nr:flagellar hook-length control protein FliK [Phenylobacterium sp.]MDP3855277.1 flagellar hook-length control protein FliK [Phenylobacterium sp.]
MTAPLLNLPIANPVAGAPGAPVQAQGSTAGFQAVLAAFFGAPGEAADLLGEGDPTGAVTDERAAAETAPVDPALATTVNSDALAFAAQLAAPQVQAPVETAAAPEAADAPPAAAPPVFTPVTNQGPNTQPPRTADGKVVTPAAPAPAPVEGDEQAAAAQSKAPATEDAAIAAVATVPEEKKPAAAAPLNWNPAAAPRAPAVPLPKTAPIPAPAPIAAAVAGPAPVPTETLVAEAAPAVEPVKDKPVQGSKSSDANRKGAPHTANVAAAPADDVTTPNAIVAATDAASLGDDGSSGGQDHIAAPATREAKPERATANAADAQAAGPAAPAHASAQAQAHASIQSAVRGAPETVANLAAQIVKNLQGRSTRFDVELNPIGLGQVNVAIEIAANGRMTAAMSFETQQAATELRGRSSELQRALEQAGFDVSGGLTFDVAGERRDGGSAWAEQQQQQQANGGAWRGRAFQAVLGTAGDAANDAAASALNLQRRTRSGVDVRI